jgi:hypothetical protein
MGIHLNQKDRGGPAKTVQAKMAFGRTNDSYRPASPTLGGRQHCTGGGAGFRNTGRHRSGGGIGGRSRYKKKPWG